jgi:hypothetical protein
VNIWNSSRKTYPGRLDWIRGHTSTVPVPLPRLTFLSRLSWLWNVTNVVYPQSTYCTEHSSMKSKAFRSMISLSNAAIVIWGRLSSLIEDAPFRSHHHHQLSELLVAPIEWEGLVRFSPGTLSMLFLTGACPWDSWPRRLYKIHHVSFLLFIIVGIIPIRPQGKFRTFNLGQSCQFVCLFEEDISPRYHRPACYCGQCHWPANVVVRTPYRGSPSVGPRSGAREHNSL